MINIATPIIDAEEITLVNEVLRSGMLAQGPKVAAFEDAVAKYCGTTYALAVNSGTAALHSSLYALGIGPGDEVVTTPFSFMASINTIIILGARPVLVDIEPQSFNIDPAAIEKAITPKTKAIMPVHLYGQPVNWLEIETIAKRHNLKLIEDACQAIGAEYKGKKAGSLGDVGCFSLYATKNIMSGEGGFVTTNDATLAETIRSFRQHGMTAPYEYAHVGLNYRMSDLHAAIALAQTKHIDDFNSARQKNAQTLTKGLKNIKGLQLPTVEPNRSHVYHQYTIRITDSFPIQREQVIEQLKKRDIGSAIYYSKPLHAFPHVAAFGYKLGDFPHAEQAAKEVLSLPVHPKVTETDIQTIITAFQEMGNG